MKRTVPGDSRQPQFPILLGADRLVCHLLPLGAIISSSPTAPKSLGEGSIMWRALHAQTHKKFKSTKRDGGKNMLTLQKGS